MMLVLRALLLTTTVPVAGCAEPSRPPDGDAPAILVYTRTLGFRHASIEDGIAALRELGRDAGFEVYATGELADFLAQDLDRYGAVVFLSTTGDVLDAAGEAALRAYVEAGGGFVGVHSAADTEYNWAWYGELLGTWFRSHPEPQTATVRIVDAEHPSTSPLPSGWERFDEWYDFASDPTERVQVLATLDEGTYDGGRMGASHPIAWYREIGSGRSWYTGMGHTRDSFADPLFRAHLLGGIVWAAGWEEGVPEG